MSRLFSLGLGLLVVVAFAMADDKTSAKAPNKIEGTITSVSGNTLTVTGLDKKEQTFTLGADSAVICDGKACKPADLKPGLKVMVTLKEGDPKSAARVEAFDKTQPPPKTDK
jgi:hypothetical protein